MKRFALFFALLALLLGIVQPTLATVPVVTPNVSYTANGAITTFAYPFRVFAATDLVVTVSGATKTLNVDYTVTGAGSLIGGNVVFTVAPANTAAVRIVRATPLDRATNYTEGGALRATTLNADLDRIVSQLQDQGAPRALKFPAGDTTAPTLPAVADRANKVLAFGPTGAPIVTEVEELTGQVFSATPLGDAAVKYDASGALAAADVTAPNIIHKVATIADLRNLAGSTGRTAVQVLGYYAAGDGGGGPVRYWDAASVLADNGGRVIKPTATVGAGRWVWRWEGPVDVRWYGAKDDGVTDATLTIEAAITDEVHVDFGTNGTFVISDYVDISSKVRKLTGSGATIKYHASIICGIRANLKYDVTIDGLIIDANNNSGAGRGIYFTDSNRCVVKNCTIKNNLTGYAILFRASNTAAAEGWNQENIIHHNNISGQTFSQNPSLSWYGIVIDGAVLFQPGYTDVISQWKALKISVSTLWFPERCQITNNVVVGGLYAASLFAVRDSVVSDNVFKNQRRNIALENSSYHNLISNNQLLEFGSTAVLLGYSSNYNTVEGNKAESSIAIGQAVILINVGSQYNRIINNDVILRGFTGEDYIVYLGVHASHNEVSNNRLAGTPDKAAIAIESEWDSTTTETASRCYTGTAYDCDEWTNTATTNCTIKDNTLSIANETGSPGLVTFPHIYISSHNGINNNGHIISGNKILASTESSISMRVYEESGTTVFGLEMENNRFLNTDAGTYLPRGRAHFAICSNNYGIDQTGDFVSISGATPSVKRGTNFTLSGSTPTTITDFLDGMDGQTINLVTNPNYTIQHAGGGNIRLSSGANYIGVNYSDVITLTRRSGLWFEVSRVKVDSR